jgi:tRNA pseudouridine55 synthase
MPASTPGMDGILVVAKEPGFTSHDVVALVRRLTGTRRAGHGGTLDPFASGVLPVFLGLGTRIVEYHMADDKAYRAAVCFGATSETDDRDGEIVPGSGPVATRAAVEAALAGFRGPILQRPPDYSALKVAGRRAYDLARQGTPAELAPRAVVIKRLDLVEWYETEPGRPTAVVEIECGAGTYIRSLARDLGERLGCGAYLGALARTASGPFTLAAAHSLDEIRAAAADGPEALAALLLPIHAGLEGIPGASLNAAEVTALAKGQQVKPALRPELEPGSRVRFLAAEGSLVGIGSWKGGRLVPEKIFIGTPPVDGGKPGGDEGETAGANSRGADEAAADAAGAARAAAQAATASEPRLRIIEPRNRMTVVPGVSALTRPLGRLYLAVGVFDGLHRGHLYLLRELCRAARRAGARPAVITFDAHPEELIEGLAPPLLCDPDERLVRLQAAGIEVAVVQHFDHALRITPYDAFVAAIREHVEVAGFVMTPDAAFGFERGGTPETLAALGEREGFRVTVVSSFLSNGEQVRSSEIRRRVSAGDIAGARSLLGRSIGVTGRLGPRQGDSASGPVPVAFELPVSLPPDGRYSVVVGPAWALKSPPVPAGRPDVATITAGSVELGGELGGSPGDRVRVVFNAVAPELQAASRA